MWQKISCGESVQESADCIVETTGMNKNSATMYLYAVQGMFNATIYKRAVSAKAMKEYYDNILKDYGSEGLKSFICYRIAYWL